MDRDSKVVVGSYRNPEDVKAALQRLKREGYKREDVTLYTEQSNLDGWDMGEVQTVTDEHKDSDLSFWEKVKDMVSYDNIDEERADAKEDFLTPYRQDIRSGYTVVAVDNYIGDSGKEMEAPPTTTMDDTTERETIQLKEERLHVDKEEVQTGEVHVRKETVHDTETIEVPVEREEIVIERKPVTKDSTEPKDIEKTRDNKTDRDGESITIPITEERIIVEKEPVVTEEVEIKKERKEEVEHISEDVRREEIDIDSTGNVRRKDTNLGDDTMDPDRSDLDDLKSPRRNK